MPWWGQLLIGVFGGALAFYLLRLLRDDFINRMRKELGPLRELTPNGGTSMKDKVTQLDQALKDHRQETTRAFDDVKRHLNEQDRRIDGLYREKLR